MTTETIETERPVSKIEENNAEKDAAHSELVGAIDELLPPVNMPKEIPPIMVMAKKPMVKKESAAPVMRMKLKDIELMDTWNRDKLQNIDKLTVSILSEGQITPIVVFIRADGKAVLIDGRRRYAALKEAGMAEALVTVKDCDEKEAQRLSLAANAAKENHTPMELCRTFCLLRDQGNTLKQIVAATTFTDNQVTQHLRLECLPPEAKKMLDSGKIDFTSARALCRLNYDDPRDLKYFDRIIAAIKSGKKVTAASLDTAIDKWINRRKEVDKAAGKKEEKKRGRKAAPKKENYDYQDPSYVKQMKPLSVKKVGEYLNALQEKKNNARNPNIRNRIDERMRGLMAGFSLADLD
jgi:ParB/RepB/Spo0J family partition protein